MKIIDILNKKANGTLEDGFKFGYENKVYTYNKAIDNIDQGDKETAIGRRYVLENRLNDEVLLFQDKTKTRQEENKEIKELSKISFNEFVDVDNEVRFDLTIREYDKINELVRAVNKLTKERENN